MITPELEAEAIRLIAGLDISAPDLMAAVDRTFLRGYACERRQGFEIDDYSLPAEAHQPIEHSSVPQFNTEEFFAELRVRVMEELDRRAVDAAFM
jgi:hypothetical protein